MTVDQKDADFEKGLKESSVEEVNPGGGKKGEYHDEPHQRTYARWLAGMLSDRFDWYDPQYAKSSRDAKKKARNPNLDDEMSLKKKKDDEMSLEKKKAISSERRPNIDIAWAFFEHYGLPRCKVEMETNKHDKAFYELVKSGKNDEKTTLFPLWRTDHYSLGRMGIGVGLYFDTLVALSLIMLVAFAMNIPVMTYYASTSYARDEQKSLSIFLRGSSICTDISFEPCPNCTKNDWHTDPVNRDTYAEAMNGTLHFIRVNHCNIDRMVGPLNFASLLVFLFSIVGMIFWLRYRTTAFDKDVQTARDYSIIIEV